MKKIFKLIREEERKGEKTRQDETRGEEKKNDNIP